MNRSFAASRAKPAAAAVRPATQAPTPPRPAPPTPTQPTKSPSPQPAQPPKRSRRWAWLALPALLAGSVAAFVEIERRPVRLCRQWEREAGAAKGDTLRATITSLDAYGSY